MSKIIGNTGGGPTPLEQTQQMAKIMELLKNSTGIKCDECKNDKFMEVLKIRKVSGLATGTGQEMIFPVPVYACSDCGHVNKFFDKSTGIPEEESEPTVTQSDEK
jgi:uncharacterized Zn finger protein